MAIQSFNNIARKQRTRSSTRIKRDRVVPCELVFCRLFNAGKTGKRQVAFLFSEELCREAGLYPGDRIDIAFDKATRTGFVHRVATGGYTLSMVGVEKAMVQAGAFYRCKVSFTYYQGMPHIGESAVCENLAISDKRIVFTFPPETRF